MLGLRPYTVHTHQPGERRHRTLRPGARFVRRRRASGFTLIELAAVLFLVAIIGAITIPQVLPAIAFSQLEGTARRLSSYGSEAIAEAALLRNDVVVYVDLGSREIWCTQMIVTEPEEDGLDDGDDADVDQLALFEEFRRGSDFSPAELAAKISGGELDDLPEDFDLEKASAQFANDIDAYVRDLLVARWRNVEHDESALEQIGDLFDDDDGLFDEEEMEEVEIEGALLGRMQFSEEVILDRVIVDGETHSRDLVSIPISPLGLEAKVAFYLTNESGDYYTVVWDPLSNGTKAYNEQINVQ